MTEAKQSMTEEQIQKEMGRLFKKPRRPPNRPDEALRRLIKSVAHHGEPLSWPEGFYEQLQHVAGLQIEAATEEAQAEDYRARAKDEFEEAGVIEIPSTAPVSISDEGAFVQAWLWVGAQD
ncbi:hypothetical protein [Myxococcus sp. CA040A]|uniref:hypothetical protein n=1 Tax=Myxococcus sp. CA040A TaxID=2741738 RepID=UPI00157B2346|nr:hypothetical protein [Myxococcus sp. CA040A]NTX07013.1 hypothetical protein [Myxococcus sp. CA040A]